MQESPAFAVPEVNPAATTGMDMPRAAPGATLAASDAPADGGRHDARTDSADRFGQLGLIVGAMPYACVVNDVNLSVTAWNPAAERMFGWPAAEVLGRMSLDLIVPVSRRDDVIAAFARLARGETVKTACKENLTRSGTTIMCEWSMVRLIDGDGRFIGYLSTGVDVTARVAAERALARSEARFRQLTELSSDWYWEQDADFRFVRTDTLGYRGDKPLGESAGLTRWERPGTRPVDTTWDAHRRVLEAHMPFDDLVLELRLPDGRRSFVAVRGEPIVEASGAFRGYRGVGSDITERYRGDMMRAGERRVFDLLAADTPLARVMEALCEAIESVLERPGVATLLAIGDGVLRHLAAPGAPPPYQDAIAAGVVPGVLTGSCGEAAYRNEVVVCEDILHDAFWVRHRESTKACGFAGIWSTPVIGVAGQVVAVIAVYGAQKGAPTPADLESSAAAAALAGVVFERFQAQAAARESDARYRNLVELAQEGVLIHDDGVVKYANPALARLLKAPSTEALVERSIFDLFEPDSQELVRRRRRRVVEHGQSVGYVELRIRCFDGSVLDVEDASGPVERQGRRMVQASMRDIGARKWAEREMQRLNESLEQKVSERTAELTAAVHELEAFTYTVAHDLRAPLRAVDGYAQLMRLADDAGLSDEARRDLDKIAFNARRMAQLIDGLLEYSRLGRGATSYQRMATRRVVDAVLAQATDLFGFNPQVDIGTLPDVFGDAAMLRQVWANLIFNAFKFSAKTGGPRIVIACEFGEGELVFSVRDNGAGFDGNYGGKLFGVFQRLHSRGEFEGTGVGLAIVKRIVERHHGRVSADGVPGQGATFRFTLPATSTADVPPGVTEASPVPPA